MRRLLLLVSAIVLVDTMFYAAITPLLPSYSEDLGLSKSAAGVLTAAYPAGTLKEDKVVGSYKIYEGTIQIPVTVLREAGDSGPLEFDVRINACDKSKCLQPSTVRVKVE